MNVITIMPLTVGAVSLWEPDPSEPWADTEQIFADRSACLGSSWACPRQNYTDIRSV